MNILTVQLNLLGLGAYILGVSIVPRFRFSDVVSSYGSREVCGECVITSCVKAGVCSGTLQSISEHSNEYRLEFFPKAGWNVINAE